MDTKRKGPVVRTAVTKLLRRYFEDLRTRLAAGTSDLWNRVEHRLSQTPDGGTAPPRETQTTQRPVQQPQMKDEGKA